MQSTGDGGRCRLVNLVQAMAQGDEIALSSVYEQTVAQVYRIARAILDSKEDAEEVVYDVYAYAWQHATAYDQRRGDVAAWLAIIAKSRAIDRRRQQRAHVSLDETRHQALAGSLIDEGLDPERMLSQSQAGSALHVALQSLTPRRRQLIDLAFFQGLTHQELADAIGMRLGTVKSHLRRALATLQDRLAADE
jgi:RNA polymerase sigma-70 factor (ECF subfamily)